MAGRKFSDILKKESFLLDFLFFGFKELRACVFAGSFFIILFLSNHINLGAIPRYDFLFICALGIQILMVILKFEDMKEVLAISIFHIVGLVLELYKTSPLIGSWSYPDQTNRWNLVSVSKISSWSLLVIVSFLIVAIVKQKRRSD